MLSTTDTELTQRAACGDREAFARVYDHSLPPVWAFACQRARGQRAAAEALTSRILRRMFVELASYDGQVPFAAWLLAVAQRVAAAPAPRALRPTRSAPPYTPRHA